MTSLTSEIDRRVTALQAQALINDFLSDSLPVGEASLSENRFTADLAELVDNQWRVPVIFAYPRIGSVGEVGAFLVDTDRGSIVSHTPLEQMKQTGMELYTANRDAIEAAFL